MQPLRSALRSLPAEARSGELPLTLMAQSAFVRLAGVAVLLAVLWLAIWWAAAKP